MVATGISHWSIYFWHKIYSQRHMLESDDSFTGEDAPEIAPEEKQDNCVCSQIGKETIKW